jgi:methylmalonyl-CoA mutase cobalamin-binding domain/chain
MRNNDKKAYVPLQSFKLVQETKTKICLLIIFDKKLIRMSIHRSRSYSTKKEEILMSWLKSMMEKEPPEPKDPIGTVVIGTLDPDVHLTPKEMVRKSLKKAGFKCIDVGKKAPAADFATQAKANNADIVAVSINTAPAKNNIPQLMAALESAGVKDKVTIMIGGAAVDKDDADEIGALFGETREEAVALAKKALGK